LTDGVPQIAMFKEKTAGLLAGLSNPSGINSCSAGTSLATGGSAVVGSSRPHEPVGQWHEPGSPPSDSTQQDEDVAASLEQFEGPCGEQHDVPVATAFLIAADAPCWQQQVVANDCCKGRSTAASNSRVFEMVRRGEVMGYPAFLR
jgi:hypothetical protein